MFISWAVTSYQSNGAGCDFSQGISVCLIEILYPISLTGRPGLRRRPCAPLVHFRAILTLVTLSPLCCCSFLRSLSRDLCLLSCFLSFRLPFAPSTRTTLFRSVLSSFTISPPTSFLPAVVHVPQGVRLSFGFIGSRALIDIAFCPSWPFIARARFVRLGHEVTEDSRVSLAMWRYRSTLFLSSSLSPSFSFSLPAITSTTIRAR